jgi:CRP-like cAMP-binding protein
MSIEDDITFLSRVPAFALLGREALRILAIGAESRYVHEGDELFHQGEAADAGFLVQEGSFRLDTQLASPGVEPIIVGKGTLLGEIAMVTETVRPATAIACEPSSVLRIPRKLFLKMLEGYPVAAKRLRDLVAARAEEAMRDISNVRSVFDIAETSS